jgi:cytochrome c oxidase assembly protein subunit 15
MHAKALDSKVYWLGVNIFMVASMVIIGGITRITNSGLSMTEWNLIEGIFPPLNLQDWNILFDKYKATPEYEFKNFNITLSEFKFIFFWEYFHRIWGRLIGFTFIVPFLYFWFTKKFSGDEKKFFIILIIIGIFQAFMGWFMVKSGLIDRPDVSHFRLSAHLTIAFIIYIMLTFSFWSYLDKQSSFERSVRNSQIKNHSNRIIFSIILLISTIASGAFVSGTNAGWAYNNFPLMGDNFLPPILYGKDNPALITYFNDIGFIQFFHRVLATLTLFLILYTTYKALKDSIFFKLKKYFYSLGFFIVLQYALGITILKLFVPAILGLFHQFGSLVILTILVILLAETKNRGARKRPSVQ